MSEIIEQFMNGRVAVCVGDITDAAVDGIVNAANSTLLGGGGVDGAIHRRGGAAILAECQELRRTRYPHGLPTGEAVVTSGGMLSAKYVIHTVGPVYGRHGGREAELLGSCYRESLRRAVELELASIAFPAISTGAYGYPAHEAARVVSEAVAEFLEQDQTLREVRLVFFQARDAKTFLRHSSFSFYTEKVELNRT